MRTRPIPLTREKNPNVRIDLRGVDRQQHPPTETTFKITQDLRGRRALRRSPRGKHCHVDPPRGQLWQPVPGLNEGKLHRHAC